MILVVRVKKTNKKKKHRFFFLFFVKYESGTGSVYYGKVTCTISLTAVNL